MKKPLLITITKTFVIIFLLSFYAVLLSKPIDLTTSDLGRHLKNGETALSAGRSAFVQKSILNSNFYSFTNSDYPFINHHWLAGVIFFIVKEITGFTGLSIFYIILSLAAFIIFFISAKNQTDFKTAAVAAILLIPLIAARREVRPEVFGYLFGAIFLWRLLAYKKGGASASCLWLLPIFSILWVNLHISFFVGILLIGVFWLEALIREAAVPFLLRKKINSGVFGGKIKKLTIILAACLAGAFLNPNTWRGVLYPLKIFENYGYRIVENQSIWFLEKYGLDNPNLLHFEAVFILMSASFINVFIKRKDIKISNLLLFGVFSAMAWFGLRNLTFFGFFMLPVLTFNLYAIIPKKLKKDVLLYNLSLLAIAMLAIVFIDLNSHEQLANSFKGLRFGLAPGNKNSAEFFKEQNFEGPIFNNYDSGSFLIYELYPKEKVFVDNRPEAYPAEFFENVYVPMQEEETEWEKQEQIYHFNAIFFGYHDLTPWAQTFLVNRVNDQTWAPVYADDYVIVFLKRSQLNQEIIKKYEIPKKNFKVIKNE